MENMDALLDAAEDSLEWHRSSLSALMSGKDPSEAERLKQLSVKHGMVAIITSWSYLEACLYYHGRRKHGQSFNDALVFEATLMSLGVTEEAVLKKVRNLRNIRRALIRGKRLELHCHELSKVYVAENEAEQAVSLALEVRRLLGS
ncbi:hypothetical protein [Pseudomonas sp. 2023EL-01195]|uniref:hypothetical protein n=1 Tax=Pseudomonas sp. 2023EL-01195 TaxID=3088134 RepID=UPI00296AFA5C|nr:hypothetical protein [Pseudomonas sp. 2023EL-01195]MDW3716591.1 hypothetical protein [Pseudomonas sp. 2023EL-01195]